MGYYGRCVVLDFETGGLNHEIHGVTEVAMVSVDMDTLEIVDRFETLIKPYAQYTKEAEETSGITMEMIEKDGIDVMEAVDKMCDFLYEQRVKKKKPIIAGHNLDDFDIYFLEQLFDLKDIRMKQFINTNITVDTMKLSRLRFIDSAKHSLGAACSNSGILLKEAHRAMPDTEATAKLFIEMIKSLRGNGEVNEIEKPRVKYQF